jgi:hypothetical protein
LDKVGLLKLTMAYSISISDIWWKILYKHYLNDISTNDVLAKVSFITIFQITKLC